MVTESAEALKCVGVLVRYLDLGRRESLFGKLKVQPLPPPGLILKFSSPLETEVGVASFPRLHPPALRALDLLGGKDGRERSLFKVLDRTCSPLGRRLLEVPFLGTS